MVAFNKTRKFANIFQKVNSLGAAVVIVGALFKIQHYPGASLMLMVGLLTEAAIFIVSAFAPLPTEYHWQNIFPELMFTEEDEENLEAAGQKAPVCTVDPINNVVNKEHSPYNFANMGGGAPAKVSGGASLAAFDEMLEKAGGKNFFDKLGNNFANFNENVKDIASVSSAAAASKSFTDNLTAASTAISSFNSSAEDMANTMGAVQGQVTKLGNVDFSALTEGNQEYSNNIAKLNKNLGAVNSVFELQLHDFDSVIAGLKESVQGAKTYSAEVNKLGNNLKALNTVYGNMLTALNVKM
ncbi:MAG: gliding motility protein GldL [Bacteroidales bacterium]|nr:gliding motility protein GldL [Bacteroidales bacterium]